MINREELSDPSTLLAELYAKKKRLDVVISALEFAVASSDRGLIERVLAPLRQDGITKTNGERELHRQSTSSGSGRRHAPCRAKPALP